MSPTCGCADAVGELVDDQPILIGERRRHALAFDAGHLEAERDDQRGVDRRRGQRLQPGEQLFADAAGRRRTLARQQRRRAELGRIGRPELLERRVARHAAHRLVAESADRRVVRADVARAGRIGGASARIGCRVPGSCASGRARADAVHGRCLHRQDLPPRWLDRHRRRWLQPARAARAPAGGPDRRGSDDGG